MKKLALLSFVFLSFIARAETALVDTGAGFQGEPLENFCRNYQYNRCVEGCTAGDENADWIVRGIIRGGARIVGGTVRLGAHIIRGTVHAGAHVVHGAAHAAVGAVRIVGHTAIYLVNGTYYVVRGVLPPYHHHHGYYYSCPNACQEESVLFQTYCQ